MTNNISKLHIYNNEREYIKYYYLVLAPDVGSVILIRGVHIVCGPSIYILSYINNIISTNIYTNSIFKDFVKLRYNISYLHKVMNTSIK